MKYIKGKAVVEVKPPRGKRLIGQCNDCTWYKHKKYIYGYTWESPLSGECRKQKGSDLNAVDSTFGCWYWEKKK